MQRNEVIISGVINSVKSYSNEGALLVVTNTDKDDRVKEFSVVAFSDTASTLKSGKKGERVVLLGRLSRDRLDPEVDVFHDVIYAYKVLSIGGDEGQDYTRAYLEGEASIRKEDLKKTSSNKDVMNISIKHTRTYKDKSGSEKSQTSYHRASLWNESALSFEDKLPISGVPYAVVGTLSSSTYASEKTGGVEQKQIEIFADGFYPFQEVKRPERASTSQRTPRTPTRELKGSADNGVPF